MAIRKQIHFLIEKATFSIQDLRSGMEERNDGLDEQLGNTHGVMDGYLM